MEAVPGPNTSHEALTRLVAQYERPLLNTCCMILRDRALAEDATQETFIKAYKALPAFRGECSEKTWLMRIAVNTCRDMQRGGWFRHVDRGVPLDLLPEPAEDFRYSDADDIASALLQLPLRLREAVLMHFYQDMTISETAQVLGVSHQTVSKRIKQACARLKTTLGKEDW